MRPFEISDLLWLQPFVERQGRWNELLSTLRHAEVAWVQPKECIVYLWQDLHGTVIGGFTNLPHLKSVTKIGKRLVDDAKRYGVPLHTHDEYGTWGHILAVRWGFELDGDALWLNARRKA